MEDEFMSIIRKISLILLVTIILISSAGFSAQPAQAAGCSSYHVVRVGESLSQIARYYGAYWPYLAQINGVIPPRYTVYPGQVLCISYGSYVNYPYSGSVHYPYYGYSNYYGPWKGGSGYTSPGAYWSFSVVGVQKDVNVTIQTYNFPSNVFFKVKMGRQSNSGIQWIDLPNLDTGSGGNFKAVINIPQEFAGTNQLILRLVQEKKNGKVFQSEQCFSNIASY
jgi:hypothetical protein